MRKVIQQTQCILNLNFQTQNDRKVEIIAKRYPIVEMLVAIFP